MKKLTLFIALFLIGATPLFAQHSRFSQGDPFDLFLGIKPSGLYPFGNLSESIRWGVGNMLFVEFQMQEKHLGFGMEIGSFYFQGRTLHHKELDIWERGEIVRCTSIVSPVWALPVHFYANYYFLNESWKPYIGVGIGTLWGKYDSYSLRDKDLEGAIDFKELRRAINHGWQFGGLAQIGLSYSLNHKHLFGIEGGVNYYLKKAQMQPTSIYRCGIVYAYIFD